MVCADEVGYLVLSENLVSMACEVADGLRPSRNLLLEEWKCRVSMACEVADGLRRHRYRKGAMVSVSMACEVADGLRPWCIGDIANWFRFNGL